MNRRLKSFLQKGNIYHPLQTTYRSARTFLTNKYHRLTYRRYKGSGYTCNFCGARYTRFIPEYPGPDIAGAIERNAVIAGYGENVYCPGCGSKNRERLIKAVIEKYLPIKNSTTLHFSPEKNLYSWLRTKASVTTADTAPRFYTNIDPKIRYADATELPFEANSFDLVIANHILEHIPDDAKAMRGIHRVLTATGVAILQVPYSLTLPTTIEEPGIDDPQRQATLFGQRDHVRIYALADYLHRLKTAGFRVQTLTPDTLAEFHIHAIQQNESVFLCYKQ